MEIAFIGIVLFGVGLLVTILLLCWLWDCRQAGLHCARRADEILAELRALRQQSQGPVELQRPKPSVTARWRGSG